jgi:hypothetical protein
MVDLFRWYGIPPSPLHAAVQEAARQAGWTPPWDRDEQRAKKKVAGKKSGASRAGLAHMRHSLLRAARMRLKPQYRKQPYATESIAAIQTEYQKLLAESGAPNDLVVMIMLSVLSEADRVRLRRASRDTIVKDLKALKRLEKGFKTPSVPSWLTE